MWNSEKIIFQARMNRYFQLNEKKLLMCSCFNQQVEELENEKRQLIARLKSQEKRVDHLERAKRKEEIPLLLEASKQV